MYDKTVRRRRAVLGLLVDQGFTIREAHVAYSLVSACASGAAPVGAVM